MPPLRRDLEILERNLIMKRQFWLALVSSGSLLALTAAVGCTSTPPVGEDADDVLGNQSLEQGTAAFELRLCKDPLNGIYDAKHAQCR